MPKIRYREINLSAGSRALVDRCNTIIAAYQAQGFVLTLRQLYYQLVSRAVIPNKQTEYNRLGSIVNDARLAGLIDWDAIEDRTRSLRSLSHWESPASIVKACAKQFHVDMWAGQRFRPEVWIEKDALVGVIEAVCEEFDVPYFSCRGYTSQSEMWRAAMRLKAHARAGQEPIIFHFGDHDPSGKDMTRDIVDRLDLFMSASHDQVELQRLALNMDQVRRYNPPPNPAKVTDSRFRAYVAEFGGESWELDALEPAVIAALIRTAVRKLIDFKKWKARTAIIESGRKALADAARELGEKEGEE